jgi:hypothetical protein
MSRVKINRLVVDGKAQRGDWLDLCMLLESNSVVTVRVIYNGLPVEQRNTIYTKDNQGRLFRTLFRGKKMNQPVKVEWEHGHPLIVNR